jgi:hypothetical protein
MLAPILIFVLAVAIVATYILVVNRFLRSDEHWNENGQALAPATKASPVSITLVAPARGRESFKPERA